MTLLVIRQKEDREPRHGLSRDLDRRLFDAGSCRPGRLLVVEPLLPELERQQPPDVPREPSFTLDRTDEICAARDVGPLAGTAERVSDEVAQFAVHPLAEWNGEAHLVAPGHD